MYTPAAGESQLTARAVITGCLIGGVVAAMNISLGLKIGWSFGGSLIAAILGYAVFIALRPKTPYSVLETNITQTSGSAAGSMASAAGLLAPIPALMMLNKENPEMGMQFSYLDLTFWALSVGFLGVFFAVPLRNQYVVVEKLRFPTGTATAETIVSIFAEGAEALRKARVLLIWAIIAALFVLAKYKWFAEYPGHYLEKPSILWAGAVGTWLVAWGFVPYLSPVMFGAGLLVGPRIGISLALGAIVGWGIIGPWVNGQGWVQDPDAIMSYGTGVRGWILWPGVAIMVGDALMSLGLSWRTILNTFKGGQHLGMDEAARREQVPNTWWLGGLAIGTILVTTVSYFVFNIPWYLTLIAVAMSAVLAAIAVRSTGETDINPVGGMGKVTQLVFGGISQSTDMAANAAVTSNLMGAAITGSGASQASDMMQDLKTGHMLGASPRRQIIAQCIGIFAGILVAVPVFWLFDRTQDIGGEESEYPAPAAHAWKAMAELLSEGFDKLPTNAGWAVLIGFLFGAMVPVIRKTCKPIAPYMPSGLAFGISFIVPAYYPLAIFAGSMMLVIWRKVSPVTCAALVFAVASGVIAGDGVTNVFTAIMDLSRQTFLVDVWPPG